MLYFQESFSYWNFFFRKLCSQFTSNHTSNQYVFIYFRSFKSIYVSTITKNCHFITYLKYFIHFMRYINNSNSYRLQISDHIKQIINFFICNRRSWLIHDYYPGVL